MKLLLAAVFTPDSTNTPMASALESLGNTVVRFPYRVIGKASGPFHLNDALVKQSKNVDAVVVCKGLGGNTPPIEAGALKAIKCPTVYWLPDSTDVQGLPVIELALACKIACATSLLSCDTIARWGHKHVSQIFEGYDHRVFRSWDGPKTHDVTFVGSMDAHRESMIEALRCAGQTVDRPVAYTKELSKVYSASKVVLNFVRGQIFSDRVIQAMASGTYLLSEHCHDLDAAFDPGKDLDVFWTWHELPGRVAVALESPVVREEVAQSGMKAVKRFRWRNQMEKLVGVIEGQEVHDGAFTG